MAYRRRKHARHMSGMRKWQAFLSRVVTAWTIMLLMIFALTGAWFFLSGSLKPVLPDDVPGKVTLTTEVPSDEGEGKTIALPELTVPATEAPTPVPVMTQEPTQEPTNTPEVTPVPTEAPTNTPKPTRVPTPEPTATPEIEYDTSMGNVIMTRYMESAVSAAGPDNSAWITDGRVTVIGRNDMGQCDTSEWENIVAVALGESHVMGLTEDGKILFAGDNTYGQCALDVGEKKVVSIAACARASFAVLEDGSVRMSGNYVVNGSEFADERNVAVAAASDSHLVLLKRDGTLVAFGENRNGECDVKGLEGIEMVACGYSTTAALDSEGVVHIAGETVYGQSALDGTVNAGSVAAGGNFCIVVLKDGTAIGAGSNSRGQISIDQWQNVKSVSCGYMHTIAVLEDGTRLYAGNNNHGQLEQA